MSSKCVLKYWMVVSMTMQLLLLMLSLFMVETLLYLMQLPTWIDCILGCVLTTIFTLSIVFSFPEINQAVKYILFPFKDKSEQCIICYNSWCRLFPWIPLSMSEYILPCGHRFHRKCLIDCELNQINMDFKCPACRRGYGESVSKGY
eukprot:131855_1